MDKEILDSCIRQIENEIEEYEFLISVLKSNLEELLKENINE